jgi:hypothetical protein
MKPNVEICRQCACNRHIVWRSKTNLKIKQLTPEQVYKTFDKNIKRRSGLIKWCPAVAQMYIGSSGVEECGTNPGMRINRDFDQDDEMAPKSNLCPYFTEQVISNES